MRQRSFLTLLILAVAAFGAALWWMNRETAGQVPDTAEPVTQAEAEAGPQTEAGEPDPALWSISDADFTVYLFGTVHILPPELDWYSDEVRAAFGEADTLYLEVDALSPQAQAEMQSMIPQIGMLPAGERLTAKLSEEALADLEQIAGRLGMPGEALKAAIDPFMPWLASLQLAIAQMQAAGYDPQSGVEQVLTAEAGEAGMAFGYFETIEEQLAFLSSMPMEVQLADFETGLEQMVENPDMLDDLVEAWAAGDMERLDAIMNAELRDTTPEAYSVLIVQRNRNWAPQIAEILEGSGTAFVAVGAGHMPGEEGVINLLREQGLEVTRH